MISFASRWVRSGAHLVVALALATACPAGHGEAAPAAEAVEQSARDAADRIDRFHDILLDVMRSGAGFDQRAAVLAPEIAGLFDVGSISRISLGRTWKTLDETSRSEFSGLLEELIVATYADRFDSYNRQVFHRIAAEPVRNGWVVKTELEKSDGERVTLDYYLRDGKVFNVVADGVSDLSLRRADYNSIIKSEGYDRLLSHVRENIAKHRMGDAEVP